MTHDDSESYNFDFGITSYEPCPSHVQLGLYCLDELMIHPRRTEKIPWLRSVCDDDAGAVTAVGASAVSTEELGCPDCSGCTTGQGPGCSDWVGGISIVQSSDFTFGQGIFGG